MISLLIFGQEHQNTQTIDINASSYLVDINGKLLADNSQVLQDDWTVSPFNNGGVIVEDYSGNMIIGIKGNSGYQSSNGGATLTSIILSALNSFVHFSSSFISPNILAFLFVR